MNEGSVSLLRLLTSGVRGFDAQAGEATVGPRESAFATMFAKAARGELRSDLPVRVPAALDNQIDRSLREQISGATDLAASEGISRALVLAGERMFRVDVASRTVIDAPGVQRIAVGDVDGVVRMGQESPVISARELTDGPARVVRNISLLRVLADRPAPAE